MRPILRIAAVALFALFALMAAACTPVDRVTGTATTQPTATVGGASASPTPTTATPVATAEFAFLTLRAERTPGTNPRAVRFTMQVVGGPDNNPGLYCKGVDWDFADGQKVIERMECIPWTQETKIQRTFTFDHVYDHPGKYAATVRIPDASLQASTTIDIP